MEGMDSSSQGRERKEKSQGRRRETESLSQLQDSCSDHTWLWLPLHSLAC